MSINLEENIFVAGHRGMVGSAICRQLQAAGYKNIITCSHAQLDLTNQAAVDYFFANSSIDRVYLAAAKVGGIHANNTYPADFIYQNIMIEANIIQAAHKNNVQHLLFLGSSCIYPKLAPQPMAESKLLTGLLEPTNEPYAIAKIAGIKLCESYNRQFGRDYRSVMPTNLYGPGDNYHPENSHVIPALIRRFHEAKHNDLPNVVVWGSGTPRREFLHVDDMASASIHVMSLPEKIWQKSINPMCSHINVGYGIDYSIRELAEMVANIVEYSGSIVFDTSKPDGAPRKLMDSRTLEQLGWQPKIDIKSGLIDAYCWFVTHMNTNTTK